MMNGLRSRARSPLAALVVIAASITPLTAVGGGTALAAAPTLHNDYLAAVAAAPGGVAWAVGSWSGADLYVSKPLIERWNGTSWRLVPSPAIGGTALSSGLRGVAALSSSNAWAVGSVRTSASVQSLILHWNGKSWRRVASPSPGGSSGVSLLEAVTAVSSSNAWAVGYYQVGHSYIGRTLILHWNGRSWKQVASPSPGPLDNELYDVAAVSRSSAWAVGNYYPTAQGRRTLVLRWNGRAWKQIPSPNPSGTGHNSLLNGVAVASPTSVWAAGSYAVGNDYRTLIEHWNGKTWKSEASPNGASTQHTLYGVAALSPSSALAVGYYSNGVTSQSLAERWDGRAWKLVGSPSPGGVFGTTWLNGIAAVSAASAWAVGIYQASSVRRSLIVRWNGSAWRRVPSPNL